MPQTATNTITLTETTVGTINGYDVAVGGITKRDGERVVDLTINRVKVRSKKAGDVLDINGENWVIDSIKKGLFARKGEVTFRKG